MSKKGSTNAGAVGDFRTILHQIKKIKEIVADSDSQAIGNKALHSTLISFDDSDGENDVVLVRPLPWRAEELGNFFKELDQRYETGLAPPHKRMMLRRACGANSDRDPTIVPHNLRQWVTDI